jgi:NADP-dependent 3-hydroxy acid dehydrogenase YdfG
MKISITGHTGSLGKAIFENLSQKHSVSGYSRSTGWDFNEDNIIDLMIDEVCSSDVFINNTFHCQWLILPKIIEKFKFNEEKIIINIGSFHSYTQPDDDYGKIKNNLKELCFSAQANPEIKCRVVNISPSLISETNASVGKESIAMLSKNDVCRVIDFIIDSPPHFLINEIVFTNKDISRSFYDSQSN